MRTRSRLIPLVIVALAAAFITYVIVANLSGGTAVPDGDTDSGALAPREPGVVSEVIEPQTPERVNVERHDDDDPLAVGDPGAPVTIVMYSDFQCAFCALWNQESLPEIMPYVDDGRVRIEWRDIAVFGPDSERAAYAAYAAALQGKYREFSGTLFDGGSAPSPSQLTDESLVSLAREVGLDVEKFNADRASEAVAARMQETFAEAAELGVFSTPAFLINGRAIVGAQPTPKFIETIEEELHG